jgi:hypothetical protein
VAVLHLRLLSFALLLVLTASLPQARLLNSSNLEMFVDQLPHLPKILGFHVVSGIPKSKSLEIGMFKKKWVIYIYIYMLVLFGFVRSRLILLSFSMLIATSENIIINERSSLNLHYDQLMLTCFCMLFAEIPQKSPSNTRLRLRCI